MKKEGRTFIADVVAFTEGVGSTVGLLLSLADGIKSAFVRCSSVVPA